MKNVVIIGGAMVVGAVLCAAALRGQFAWQENEREARLQACRAVAEGAMAKAEVEEHRRLFAEERLDALIMETGVTPRVFDRLARGDRK